MQKCIETLDTNNKSLSEYNATSIRLAAKMKPNQQIYAEVKRSVLKLFYSS